ncbi:MAG TPA: SH3 domain-containing protein [Anaeromyxobacteraceae bacterium]|nr:SH3 domain-containing protein [Anaeromyxobacteraceae bacterium]
MIRRTSLALLVLVAAACSDRKPATPPDAGAPPATGIAIPAGGAETAYVTVTTALRREPSDAARVAGPGPKRAQVANVLATLLRGEKVTLVTERDDWAQVRASDESQGWVKKAALIPGLGITEATLAAPADAFDRPDLLAVNARRKIEPGTLLLVVRSRELFSEVNTGGGPNAWVLSDRLLTGPRDVMVAKLVEKARWLVKAGRPDDARAVLDLARAQFGDVPLTQVLATELLGNEAGTPAPAPGVPPPVSPFQAAPGTEGR